MDEETRKDESQHFPVWKKDLGTSDFGVLSWDV